MQNLWRAIFLECIFRQQAKREGWRPTKVARLAWSRAFIANRFTFTVQS